MNSGSDALTLVLRALEIGPGDEVITSPSADLGFKQGDFPVAEEVSKKILPMPMSPELADEQVDTFVRPL